MPVAEGKPAQEDVSVMHTPETSGVAHLHVCPYWRSGRIYAGTHRG